MKKLLLLLTVIIMLLCIQTNCVIAKTNEDDWSSIENVKNSLESILREKYCRCGQLIFDRVEDDETAYAFLLQYKEYSLVNNGNIVISGDLPLHGIEKDSFMSFVTRTNDLISIGAIDIDENSLEIKYRQPSNNQSTLVDNKMKSYKNEKESRYLYFDLMPLARAHANTMLQIYGDNVLGTGFSMCAVYFADRVKSGGEWDYKQYLGYSTICYIPEVDSYMTGECVGNFHYGYVGKSVFSSTLLLSAAGFYQICSGTSQLSWYSSYFDDPSDQADIQWGIDWYVAYHY